MITAHATTTRAPSVPSVVPASCLSFSFFALCFSLFFFLLLPLPALAQTEPYTFRSAHYEITTDLPRDQARAIARHMDRVYAEYDRRFGAFASRGPRQSPLRICADRDGYLEYLTSEGINGAGSGGMFYHQGMKAGLVVDASAGEQRMLHTLQHEGFHQFAHMRIGETIPPWANEGLAEYFGRMMDLRGRFLTGLVDERTLRAVQRAAEQRRHFPFDELLSMTGQQWSDRLRAGDPRAGLQYAQSWLVVHFLINARGGRYAGMFLEYLKAMSRGMRHAEAFRTAFGTDDIRSFEAAWLDYIAGLEPDAVTTGLQRIEFLGAGLKFLHERAIRPATIEDLKTELRARSFTIQTTGHGAPEELSADDDAWFQPPAPERPNPRQPAEFVLLPAAGDDLPPAIELRGLRASLTLTFQRDDAGRLTSTTSIR
ncbi:MAG: DUF1570 domain-containing protein [Phycisphaerales bacterium JB039]